MNAILNRTQHYTQTYNNYYHLIFSAVSAKIHNYEEAKDICQDIFMRLYERFDYIINPRKWLYGTMRNVMYEYFNAKSNSHNNVDIEEVMDSPKLCCDSMVTERSFIIENALKDGENFRDTTDRNVFDLIAVDALTYKETAVRLGMTINQVRYRYTQIIRRLSMYFNKHGIHAVGDLL